MSGVTGDNNIKSRKEFDYVFKEYLKIIKEFPGFINLNISGSYNSNKNKTIFGDMDLILTVDESLYLTKIEVKKALIKFLLSKPENIITPFNGKYSGKRYYNSGELISISYKAPLAKYSYQINNIISLNDNETQFKLKFLNLSASKQGIILAAVKVALIGQNSNRIFSSLNINPPKLKKDQELEFNLSNKEIQLRKITYYSNTFKEKNREIIWKSTNWNDLEKILYSLDLSLTFKELVKETRRVFSNERCIRRIPGVFSSMISVKSGEKGKPKGFEKEKSIELVKNFFSVIN